MTEKVTNIFEPKATKMELNKLSISMISVLVTVAICLAAFSYKTGTFNNEIKNVKEQQLVIKNDLKEDIKEVKEKKAEKEIVNLLFQKIEDIKTTNETEHRTMLEKLDRIIEGK